MSDDNPTAVVMGGDQAGPPGRLRSLFSRNNLPFKLGVLALVLVLIGGGVYFWLNRDSSKPKTATPTQNNKVTGSDPLKPTAVNYVQLGDAELTTKVNYLLGTKQYAEAEKLINLQSDLSTNKMKLMLLLTVQQAENKTDAANETSQKIAALSDLSAGEYVTIGDQYAASGDKAKATEYYNKAIDAYNKKKQGAYKSNIARVQAKIEALK